VGIFVWQMAVLEQFPCITNCLFISFWSVHLMAIFDYIVSVFMDRISTGYEKLFRGFTPLKKSLETQGLG
jgi:hypothetical protein